YTLITVISSAGLVFASVYALWMMQQAYYGAPKSEEPIAGMNLREFSIVMLLVVLLVILGVYPQPVLDTSSAAMANIQQWYTASISNTGL
ncbi:NADH-quinone oxidoreductase subunit M, partial [Klebsiella pneumoniae]|nr:NADH-quinone oxidoreductase subunit M [Klebsiella pneumoniae]